jgi:hypothetical protein
MSGSNRFGGDHNSPVGYGRPPVNRQFKPGQSGNPKGRPKGRKNLTTTIVDALSKKIKVRDKNGLRTISKFEAIFEVQVNEALSGNSNAFAKVFQIAEKLEAFRWQPELNHNQLVVSAFEKLERALGIFPKEEEPVSADKPQTDASTQNKPGNK